jgi:hypothetical protein
MDEVYLLSHQQAPAELYDKLIAWRASYNYEFIKSLENVIIKDYSSINKKLSKQENELRKQYISWLAIGLEGDKFKALDNVRLKSIRSDNNVEEGEEEEVNDMLVHGGVL